MITEKRAYFFAWSVVAVLTAASLVVMLQMPQGSFHPLRLFHLPAAMAFVIVLMTLKLRFAPPARAAGHRAWQAKFLAGFSLVAAVLHSYMLALALGWELPLGREAGVRAGFVLLGLFTAFFANSQPKLPWLNSRFSLFPRLGDADGARLMRLTGLLGVLYGLAVALVGAFLPLRLMLPLTLTMIVGGFAVLLVRAFWLHRRPPVC